ncbi:MAG: ATP-binding protein [candidate division FCPU426 bacterium]
MTADFSKRYGEALALFLTDPGEKARQAAYDLGHLALQSGMGIMDLLQVHRDQLAQIKGADQAAHMEFLAESAAPLEMELRGYQEANRSLKELNRELEGRVASRTQRQEALAGLGRKALDLDFKALLSEAMLTLTRILDTEFGKVLQLQADQETLVLSDGLGWELPSTPKGGQTFRAVKGQETGYALACPGAVAFADLNSEIRFRPSPLLAQHQIVSGVDVRILGSEGPWGILGADSKKPRDFAPEDLRFAEAVADVVGSALRRKTAEEALTRSEERLHQSQKLEAMGRLAGGVAHDFNNLLTVINGYADLGLERLAPGDDSLRQILEDIRKAGRRAAQLTRQLLVFSHKQALKTEDVDLNALVTELQKMLIRLIPEDIRFSFEPGKDLGKVRADPGQLEQVLMNLVLNARDAMPSGGNLAITIRGETLSRAEDDPIEGLGAGAYVVLSVQDDGTGIDAATQKKIFEPFFTTKAQGHSGLGLATAYGIARQNQGTLKVFSAAGKGSRFEIWLPRAVEGAALASPASAPAPAAATKKGRETLLVVEDDPLVRRLTCGVLQAQGYSVLEASGPEEALTLARSPERPFSLMVTDMVMPVMNGRQLAQAILQLLPGLKVLYVSGYPSDTMDPQGLRGESFDFLGKPYAPSDLARKVREILDRQK